MFWLLLETLIVWFCWPALAWLFNEVFGRMVGTPTFPQMYAIMFFYSVFVNNSLVNMAVEEADKDRALKAYEIQQGTVRANADGVLEARVHQIGVQKRDDAD
jgi:hypothetical protein